MLKNIDESEDDAGVKQSWFLVECILHRASFSFSSVVRLLFSFIIALPIVSIFFVQDIFQPLIINKVFRFLLISQFELNFGTPQIVIDIIILVLTLALILLTLLFLRSPENGSAIAKAYLILLGLVLFLIVPITELMARGIKDVAAIVNEGQKVSTFQIVRISILSVSIFITVVICLAHTQFNFNPLRKGNNNWKLTNVQEVLFYLINISRVIVIVVDGLSVAFLIVSIVAECFRRMLTEGPISKINKQIANNPSNMILVTNLSVLLSLAFKNRILGFQVWVFLIILVVVYGISTFVSESMKNFYLPECDSKLQNHYDFFFAVKQKISGNSELAYIEKSFSQFVNIHFFNCKQKCFIKEWLQNEDRSKSLGQLESLIQIIMNSKKEESVRNQLIHQLWMSENGLKFDFKHYKGKSLQVEYIESYAQNTIKLIENNSEIVDSNSLMINKIFYSEIFQAAECFSSFYEEVSKSQPRLETVMSNGSKIQVHVGKIKVLFGEMMRNRTLNFKSAALYLDFLRYFLNEEEFDPEMLHRLEKIQKANQVDAVNESYHPCVTVVLDTGAIENVNMEFLKMVQMNKYEVKGKQFDALIEPSIAFNELVDKFKKSTEDCYLALLKKAAGSPVCVKISFRIKDIKGTKLGMITLENDSFSDTKSVILVDKDFAALSFTAQQVAFKTGSGMSFKLHLINTKKVFQDHVFPIKEQLVQLQMVKISTLKQYAAVSMQVNLIKTFSENHWIVVLKFTANYRSGKTTIIHQNARISSQGEVKSALLAQQSFAFRFQNIRGQISLKGELHKDKVKVKTVKKSKSIGKMEKQLQLLVVNNTILNKSLYAENIKSYRLYDGEIYNIDLEDKEAYIEMFSGQQTAITNEVKQSYWVSDYCLMFAIFLLSVILIVVSIFLIMGSRASTSTIVANFKSGQQIETFRIDFNRIMAVLRDAASDLYGFFGRDFIPHVKQSYDRIEKRVIRTLFAKGDYEVTYAGESYKGDLNELVDVVMAHVFEVIKKADPWDIVEEIHQTVVTDLNGLINGEKASKLNIIQSTIADTVSFQFKFVTVLVVGTVLYYLLMLMLCMRLTNSIKDKLSKLMVMSDSESRWYQDNSEKVKHLVEIIDKNYDVDMENYFSEKEEFTPRKKVKSLVLGERLMQCGVGMVCTVFIANLLCLLLYYNIIVDQLHSFETLTLQGLSATELYSQMCGVTNQIEHTGITKQEQVVKVMTKLDLIEKSRSTFLFSPAFNKQLEAIFFTESCPVLVQLNITDIQSCLTPTPAFIIEQPFLLGLAIYFRRIHYSIINNITETFASTGVHSQIFAKLFIYIAKQVQKDGISKVDQIDQALTIFNSSLILINVIYTIVAILMSFFLNRQITKAKKLIVFLNFNDPNSVTQKQDIIPQSLKKKNQQRKESKKHSAAASIDLNSQDEVDIESEERNSPIKPNAKNSYASINSDHQID